MKMAPAGGALGGSGSGTGRGGRRGPQPLSGEQSHKLLRGKQSSHLVTLWKMTFHEARPNVNTGWDPPVGLGRAGCRRCCALLQV